MTDATTGAAREVSVGHSPVVRPRTTEEVAEVVRRAGAEGHRIRVVGATPPHDPPGLLLSTSGLTEVQIYEPADLTVTAGAGISLQALAAVLEPHRQWLPFDPPDVLGSTLGGLVASGLSGPLATGYGALRNHVLGATVVCGDGRTLHLGGRVVKNVAGFDLLRPWVGSRGRLGVITSVCVRVFPLPEDDRVFVLRTATPGGLVEAARAVAMARVLPASTLLVRTTQGGEGVLMVRLHGAEATVDADRVTLERATGHTFEALGPDAARLLVAEARDLPGATQGVGVASALPSRLGEVLDQVERAMGPVPVGADVHGGRVRFALDTVAVSALGPLRSALEAMGGTLGVERWPDRRPVDGLVSEPSPAERALADRVRTVFDPQGVMSSSFTDRS